MVSKLSIQIQSPVEPLTDLGNFRHATNIPGGFSTLSYVQEMNQAQWETWLEHKNRLRRILVREPGFVIWDGRLEDISAEMGSENVFTVLFTYKGHYSTLDDIIDNADHSSASSTSDDEGKEIVLNFTTQLDASNEFVTAETGAIALDRSGSDKSALRTIVDPDGLLDIPSTNDKRIDFFVYADKKIHYIERAESSRPWLVSRQNGDIDFMNPVSRWRDYATSVAGRHSAGITAFSSDSVAIARTDTREIVVGSTDIDLTTATNIRDATLEERKEGRLRIENLRLSVVRDHNQVVGSLCRVRAGDTIRIVDLFSDSNTSGGDLNNRNTFYIVGTECVHENGSEHPATRLDLRLDVDRSDLAGILLRNGIR